MPGFKFSEPVDGGAILVPAIQMAGTGYPNYLGNCDIVITPWAIGYESTKGNGAITVPAVQLDFEVLNLNAGELQVPSVSVFGYSRGGHFEFFNVRFSPFLVSVEGASHLDAVGNGVITIPDIKISSMLGGISDIAVIRIAVDGFGKRTGAVGSLSSLVKVTVSVDGDGFLSTVVGSNSSLAIPKISVFGTGVRQLLRTGTGEIEIAVFADGDAFLVGVGTCSVAVPVLLIDAFGGLGATQFPQTLGDISISLVSITGSAFVQEDFEFSEDDAVLRYSFDRRLL